MAAFYQTLNNVFTDVRYLAAKDATLLGNDDLFRMANKYYALIFRELVDLNEDYFAEISFTDLVADQREYPLPLDDITGASVVGQYGGGLVKIQRLEISYSPNVWRQAIPLAYPEIHGATVLNSDINNKFDKNNPYYWFKDKSIWIAPVPESGDNVAVGNQGLYIFWIKRENEMSLTTDIPTMPKDFLNVLAEGILIDVFRKYGRTADSRQAEVRFAAGIADMREKEAHPDFEQPLVFKPQFKDYK